MSEKIEIPFIDPGLEVLQSYPHYIILEDTYIEIFSKAQVKFFDDDGIERTNWMDDIRMIPKSSVSGVEMFRGKKHQTFIVRITIMGNSVDSDFHFEDRVKAKELYSNIKNWILHANS